MRARGRGHDRLVNCVRAAMNKSVSKPKTFVDATTICSRKFAGYNAIASTFIATYEDLPVIIFCVCFQHFPKPIICKMNFSRSSLVD